MDQELDLSQLAVVNQAPLEMTKPTQSFDPHVTVMLLVGIAGCYLLFRCRFLINRLRTR